MEQREINNIIHAIVVQEEQMAKLVNALNEVISKEEIEKLLKEKREQRKSK